MNILVTGGAGYIGSHTVRALQQAGYTPIIVDNLSRGHVESIPEGVKFYNMEVQLDENLETPHKGLFVIGDGSGVTHSLSHASASGVYVARHIAESL